MAVRRKAIIIDEKDNVATALVPLQAGTTIPVTVHGQAEKVKLFASIPMGHKFALREIEKGKEVFKYGAPIGRATAPIARGEHVHVHNVVGRRGRKEGL
jgi:altronate dehydratase small subunit